MMMMMQTFGGGSNSIISCRIMRICVVRALLKI